MRLWLPTMKGECTVIKAHTGGVRSVDFSYDGKLLLTASDDKSIKLWSVASQRFFHSLNGHINWVKTAKFSNDGRLVASGGDDKTVKIWDVEKQTCVHTFFDHCGWVAAPPSL